MESWPMAAWLIAVGAFGSLIGSFLNVVILRLPPRLEWGWRAQAREVLVDSGETPPIGEQAPPGIVWESSFCPTCKTPIKPWDNIPLLGFALLRGRCRQCKSPISWQYPLVELMTALAFVACLWIFGPTRE
ncbi:MAG: prepilin peptidase, partial [Gammaproteobacteria bacterium]|nr:prepilin peptidase [Gammaproteobacteria bacterium]